MKSPGRPGEALLIVDPQVDFCPGGALPVPGGDLIFGPVNLVARGFGLVVASRDWHPPDHISFMERGGIWPQHCVAGSPGAEFHPALEREPITEIFSKATGRDQEAYSAFEGTGLGDWLRERGVTRLVVAGLATDYCVLNSVLDARALGLEVTVLVDAIGAVDVSPGDGERAIAQMSAAGAVLGDSEGLGVV